VQPNELHTMRHMPYNTAMKSHRIRGLLLGALFLAAAFPLLGLEPGDKAPPFVNLDLEKQHVFSKEHLGRSWVIVDFFATDCEGCKEELPILERLVEDFADKGLRVFVLATDPEGHRVVSPYFEQHPTTLAVLVDLYRVTTEKYGVETIPSVFLIDPEGVVVYAEVGYREDLYEQVSRLIAPEDR